MARGNPYLRPVPKKAAHHNNLALVVSTLFVIAASAGSSLLGFVREVINARYYGTQWEMDTFLAAAIIPTILFGLFNGALVSALIPIFSEYRAHDGEDELWRLANTVINGLAIVLTLGAVLGYVLAPYYVPVIAHGFPAPQMGVAIRMTRWLMPSVVAVSLGGVFTAVLNAYGRFRSAALIGIALNVVTIATVVLLNRKIGIYALVLGTAFGLVAQMLVQIPALVKIGKYRPVIDLRHPGLRRAWLVLGPIIIGSAAGQTALFFDRYFATTLSPGYMAGMNYATKLVNFPQQIFAAAIATVIFPLLATQFAKANRAGVGTSVITGLRLVNFITIPAMCALIILAHPIVQALFERGSFKSTATDLTVGLLPYAAIGLLALGSNVVLTRCMFACKQTNTTVVISAFSVLINVVLSLWWLPTLGARGLLLANSLSQTLQTIALFAFVYRLIPGVAWRSLMISTGKVIISSVVMVAALHWIAALNAHPAGTLLSRGWFLFGQMSIGSLVFIAMARLLNIEELSMAFRFIMDRAERGIVSPAEANDAPIA